MEYWPVFGIVTGNIVLLIAVLWAFTRKIWLAVPLLVLTIPCVFYLLSLPLKFATWDFEDEKLLNIVKKYLDKDEFKLVKKLPYISASSKAGGVFPASSYERCGEECVSMVKNGYVDNFYGIYFDTGFNTYKLATVGKDLSKQSYALDPNEFYEATKKIHCFSFSGDSYMLKSFEFTNIYKVCTLNGEFVSIIGYVDHSKSPFGWAKITHYAHAFGNRLDWFEVYEIINGKE